MWYRGNVDLYWIDDDYKQVHFVHKPAKHELVQEWKRMGYDYKTYTGDMYNVINDIPPWISNVSKQIGLENCGYTIYKMQTGIVMPLHVDHMDRYCQVFDVDKDKVWRCIVALENWRSGHYFEISGTPILDYKAGDYICWSSDEEHMAANIGPYTRYTLQITGTKN